MEAFGAEFIDRGRDCDEAKECAARIARQREFAITPAFHRDLVIGVASYAYEFFAAVSDLDPVYVPIGLGSGICGVIGMRDALGLATRIVGVVAQNANAYARSFAAGAVITTDAADTFADGLAVRVPDATALAVIRAGADRIVEVSEAELAEAIGIYFTDTHTLAEGAGAAPLAALIKERARMQECRVGLIMSGQNIDRAVMREVLAGGVPGRGGGVRRQASGRWGSREQPAPVFWHS